MKRVLLTNGWVRSSYAALRNLSDHGISVIVGDSHKLGMCQASHRKVSFLRYCSHYESEKKFVASVASICKKKSVGLLLPSHNETEVLARYRERFDSGVDALLPYDTHCALFNDKSRSYDFVRKLSIPVPRTVEYSHLADLHEGLEKLGIQRTVIKLRTGNSAKGVFYAESPAQTIQIVEGLIHQFELSLDRLPQVEEYVTGEGWGCSTLYWHGRAIAHFTHRRVREKIVTGGTSTLREVAMNKALEEATRRIFDSIGWHGLAMCEFKVCPLTGRFWFIEVNPRMWGSMPLAVSAGVEFPYLAYLCAVEGEETARAYHEKAVLHYPWRGRWLLGDLTVGARQLFTGQWREAYRTLFQANADSLDDFFWDDPLVFWGELGVYLENAIRGRSLNPVEKGMIG